MGRFTSKALDHTCAVAWALEARQRELGEERRQLTARVERHDELIAREATATAEARAAQVEVERLRKELEAAQSEGSGTCSR